MKKYTLIIFAVFAVFSLMAFGIMNWNLNSAQKDVSPATEMEPSNAFDIYGLKSYKSPDLFYHVDSRFIWNITKENLLNANSIYDILPKDAVNGGSHFRNVMISLLYENGAETVMGIDEFLNDDQKKLLQSAEYSTNFFIGADYSRKMNLPGNLEKDRLTYYFTIIPEKEAQFGNDQNALIEYLKSQSKEETRAIQESKLSPCRVNFVVTKEGKVKDVMLDSTSGYPDVDEVMIDLIKNLPERWTPAQNAKGEKIDQKLVFFFGKAGC